MVSRWAVILALVACGKEEKKPPPAPPPPPALDAVVVVDAPPISIDAPPIDATGVDAALDPEMAKVMASKPCCCSLASTEPEFETHPSLFCQQDMHGVCVAASKCPKPGSVEAKIAVWWQEVAEGDPTKHAAKGFVMEAFVPADMFHGLTCATKPFVTDSPRAGDDCLRTAVLMNRPPAWRAGWGCKGFSGSDLAKKTKSEREASKDVLRCGNRSNAGVFVAVDATGNVTAILINVADSR